MNTTIAEPSTANHPVVSRDRWIAERKTLLAREKELTHLRDQIARERRALPWVRIDKNYVFDTPEGPRTLAELFEGRRQLLVQHFMFAPGLGAGLPELLVHGRPQRRHERAPGASRRHVRGDLARAAGRDRALSPAHGLAVQVGVVATRSDFNFDFGVSFTPEEQAKGEVNYNYGTAAVPSRRKRPASACSTRTTRATSSTPTRPTGAAWR